MDIRTLLRTELNQTHHCARELHDLPLDRRKCRLLFMSARQIQRTGIKPVSRHKEVLVHPLTTAVEVQLRVLIASGWFRMLRRHQQSVNLTGHLRRCCYSIHEFMTVSLRTVAD
jgi:hypothetical protein